MDSGLHDNNCCILNSEQTFKVEPQWTSPVGRAGESLQGHVVQDLCYTSLQWRIRVGWWAYNAPYAVLLFLTVAAETLNAPLTISYLSQLRHVFPACLKSTRPVVWRLRGNSPGLKPTLLLNYVYWMTWRHCRASLVYFSRLNLKRWLSRPSAGQGGQQNNVRGQEYSSTSCAFRTKLLFSTVVAATCLHFEFFQ